MASSDINTSWENIRQGVKDAETLIGQKKYNMSMIKSRQTLEFMIRSLSDKAGLEETDLATSIDDLYDMKWISKTTCEHYHKIRMLGNKAVHEGHDNAYDANQAYHLLSQEVYTFANDYKAKGKRASASSSARTSGQSSSSRSSSARTSSARTSSSRNTRSRKRQASSGFSISPVDLIRVGIVILVVIFLVLIIRLVKPSKSEAEETTPATVSVEETSTAPAPTETMAETTPAAVYKTTTGLNVRSEPSTSSTKLGLLAAGTIVDYVDAYDDDWAIINYNGVQAYVASQYLEHD